jgi:phage/plasmid-associated DNA primase
MTTTNQLSLKDFIERFFSFENPDGNGGKLYLVNPLVSSGKPKPEIQFYGMCCAVTRDDIIELNKSGVIYNKGKDKKSEYKWKTNMDQAQGYELLYRETQDNIICIDVDGHKESADIKSVDEFLALETTPEIFKTFPFTISRTKNLPHFFVKLKGIDTKTLKNTYKDCFNICHGDLLINHSWESPDRILYNFHDDLPTFQWEELKVLFDEKKTTGADLLTREKQKTTKQNVNEKITEETTTTTTVTTSSIQKYKELFDVIQLYVKPEVGQDLTSHRDLWIRLCDCMKKNGLNEKYWLEFCKRNKLNLDREKEGLFNRVEGKTDIYYAMNTAKTTNRDDYVRWQLKWKTNIPYEIVTKGENDVAKFIAPSLFPVLRYTKQCVWWQFNPKTKMWYSKKHPTAVVVTAILESINETINITAWQLSQINMKDEEDKYAKLCHILKVLDISYKRFSCSSVSNQVNKLLEEYLYDEDFEKCLDKNIGFLAFKNGMMNLKTKEFRSGLLYEDFLTSTIPHDYKEGGSSYIKSVLKKILNNNDEHLEYFLTLIGYSFTGDAELEKDIYFMIDKTLGGRGDNGKTFFFDILTDIMPNYVYRSDSSLLEEKNTKKHKQMVMTKGKRLVWVEEFPKESNTDAKLIKQIGDGKRYENEVMFGTSETIDIMFKLFALSNHIPKIDPGESAVFNRYKQVSYNSHFDRTGKRTEENPELLQFIADKTLASKIKNDHINDVITLVIEYAYKFYNSGMPKIPDQFVQDTVETQNHNDVFGQWFLDNIIISSDARLPDRILVDKCGMPQKEVREGMKRKGYVYNKELKGMGKDSNDIYYKGGYKGVALKPDEDDGDNFDPVQSFCVI